MERKESSVNLQTNNLTRILEHIKIRRWWSSSWRMERNSLEKRYQERRPWTSPEAPPASRSVVTGGRTSDHRRSQTLNLYYQKSNPIVFYSMKNISLLMCAVNTSVRDYRAGALVSQTSTSPASFTKRHIYKKLRLPLSAMPRRRPQKLTSRSPWLCFKLKTDHTSSEYPSALLLNIPPFDTTMERFEPYICRTKITLERCMG